MAEGMSFQIRIRVAAGGASRNLTVAELGVLLTGINRALNKAGGAASRTHYSPQRQEPLGIRSEIIGVENGSVLLSIVSAVSDFTQQNVLQATFLAGIFGNAAWDFSKVLSKEIAHALRRIGSEVHEETARIEPMFEPERTAEAIGDEAAPPKLQTSELNQPAMAVATPSLHAKTKYSVVFEQQGIAKIEITVSATDRE